jgi:hypothetical protein
VPLVLVDPTDGDKHTVCFNKEWLPYVIGSLYQLLLQSTWDSKDKNALGLVRSRALQLISEFIDGCDGGGTNCYDYAMSSPIITWFPLSPYTDAGVTPEGYSAPPFTALTEDDPILHYLAGDVLVTGFPQPDSGILTVPAFGIDVTGTGVVEIHFINALNGGICAVTVDGDVSGTEYVELQADITSIPPESVEEVIHEIKLETSGTHHIDCRFIPEFDDSASNPIRFGGAIRFVNLCGFSEMMLDVRQNEGNPCTLEKSLDGVTWTPFADLSLCGGHKPKDDQLEYRVQDGVTQWSNDGQSWYEFPDGLPTENQVVQDFGMRIPVYETGVDKACVAASNILEKLTDDMNQLKAALGTSASALAIITLIAGLGLIVGSGGFAAPLVIAFQAELLAVGYTGLNAALTSGYYDEMYCLFYDAMAPDGICTASGFAQLIDRIQWRNGLPWNITTLWCRLYGPVGLTNMANIAGITDCTRGTCDWTSVMDFRVSDYGWVNGIGDGEPSAASHDSLGWHSGYYPIYDNYEGVRLHLNLSFNTTITRIRVWYVATLGPNGPYPSFAYLNLAAYPSSGYQLQSGYRVMDTDSIYLNIARLAVGLTCNLGSSAGSVLVTKIEVSGQGAKPPELP